MHMKSRNSTMTHGLHFMINSFINHSLLLLTDIGLLINFFTIHRTQRSCTIHWALPHWPRLHHVQRGFPCQILVQKGRYRLNTCIMTSFSHFVNTSIKLFMCCKWCFFLVMIKQLISNWVIFRYRLTVVKVNKVSNSDIRFVERFI